MSSTTVIITGASRGIGRSVAIAFAKHQQHLNSINNQHKLLSLRLIARSEEGLSQTKAMVHDVNPNVRVSTHGIDLSDLEHLEDHVRTVFQYPNDKHMDDGSSASASASTSGENGDERHSHDKVILINNAGSLGHVGQSSDLPSPTEMRSNIDFNITSSLWISSFFVKFFGSGNGSGFDAKSGSKNNNRQIRVVNMSSLCAIEPFKTMAVYCSGKAARDMYHKTLALEHNSDFVKVLNYAPGAIDTDMTTILSDSTTLDSEISQYFQKQRDEETYITPMSTAERLVDLVLGDEYTTGDHVDYWDLEEKVEN